MATPLPLAYPAACPDCPGARLDTLEDLVGATKSACGFDTVRIDARAFVPPGWGRRYAFGLVRRGVLIRQRIDAAGNAVAIDAAGAGCLFPIDLCEEGEAESTPCDYAATDLVVCLGRREACDRGLDRSRRLGPELIALHRAAMSRVERYTHARGAGAARERVRLALLTLAETLTPPRRREVVPASLQQRDMARLVGIRHETFCRALAGLERERLILREADGIRVV